MQKAIIIGNLTKDVELRTVKNDLSVCDLDVAVNSTVNSEKRVDYYRVTVWGKPAENCAKFLLKGSKVGIEATLGSDSYEDKNGVKHFVTTFRADNVEFLSAKKE